jgi:hypothetical protein
MQRTLFKNSKIKIKEGVSGDGLFATSDIEKKEVILIEMPWKLPSGSNYHRSVLRLIVSILKDDKEHFLSLCPKKLDDKLILNQDEIDNLKIHYKKHLPKFTWDQITLSYFKVLRNLTGEGRNAYICKTANKLNHSCRPNVEYDVLNEYGIIVYTAKDDIKKGEELFISYVNEDWSTVKRNYLLKSVHGFKCTCDRCVKVN